MPALFDPYHTWLGIPPEEQPPDHYRLLGIRRFEGQADVIENAAEQRLTHIRSFLAGPRATESQRVLGELAIARDVLRKADTKGAYDRKLRQKDAPKLTTGNPNSSGAKPIAPRKPVARPGAPSSAVVATFDPLAADPLRTDPLNDPAFFQPSYPYGPPVGPGPARFGGYPAARPFWQQPMILLAAVLVGMSLMGVVVVGLVVGGWMLFPGRGGPRQMANGPQSQFQSGQFQPGQIPPGQIPPGQPQAGQIVPNSGVRPNQGAFHSSPSRFTRPPPGSSSGSTTNSPPSFGPPNPPGGQVSLIQPNSAGFALQFSGPGCYVEIEGTDEMAKLDEPQTIEFWARWPADFKNQTVLGNMFADTTPDASGKLKPWTGWAFCIDREGGGGQTRHYYTTGLGPSCNGLPLTAISSDTRWHHFAYSCDGLGLEIYVDGKRAGPPRVTLAVKGNRPINLFLGPSKFADPNRNQFQGEICAFRISTSKRYADTFEPPASLNKDAETIALLDFTKEQKGVIEDLTGNGHRGLISGAKLVPLKD